MADRGNGVRRPARNGKGTVRAGRTAAGKLRALWRPAYHLASTHRRIATTIVYSFIAVAAYTFAFLLRFDFAIPQTQLRNLLVTLPIVIALRLAGSFAFRISTGRWRFVSTRDAVRLIAAAVSGSAVFFVLAWPLQLLPAVPRSVIIIDLLLFTYLTAAVWLLYRIGFELLRSVLQENNAEPPCRVLIVGAGEAGSMLSREMMRTSVRRQPVGFVDDDPAKWHSLLHGLPVFGSCMKLPQVVAEQRVQEIVIAIPSATPSQLRRVVECCEATDVTFKVLPGLGEVLGGRIQWNQVRPLRIEDLLGRQPVALELPELFGDIHRRAVLVTGAAGSIGSELSRQLARHRPGVLVLLDQSETGLFDLQRQLLDQHPDLNAHFIIADIADDVAVQDVFRRYAPARVYHAAAYKHVTMMQTNVRQAIRNNVLGTMILATCAGRHRTEKFVFVSTDKAVVPTSIMGATKRLAEMALMEVQQKYEDTAFAAVRFGNVLGSSGSVIPIFREQIEAGKPLTVTHPDATRYFMMIPEAVQLVLQASLLPEVRGRIAMLDMGEPVRIVDLARNLLRFAGLPHKNGHSIVFTNLRPGEKLHEELLAPGECTRPTRIEKVRIVDPEPMPPVSVIELLREWELAFRTGRHDDVLAGLVELFPGLRSTTEPVVIHAPA
jgi:FlaA1/EpsC-like NDP-sugar epimerase